MPPCEEHHAMTTTLQALLTNQAVMQKDIEYLRRDTETILARFGVHVQEAEKPGGRHERLKTVEDDIVALEKKIDSDRKALEEQMRNDRIMGRWFMIGTGLISGGVVSGAIKVWSVLSKTLGV